MPTITRTDGFGFDHEVEVSDAEFARHLAEQENELLRAEVAARDAELAERAKPGAQIITEGVGTLLFVILKLAAWAIASILIGGYVAWNFIL